MVLPVGMLIILVFAIGATGSVCKVPQTGGPSTHSSAMLQTFSERTKVVSNLTDEACNEGSWPDRDHGRVCGPCKVLVDRFNSHYHTCQGYCGSIGRHCKGAWEERDDTCDVLHDMTCDERVDSSDAICECGEINDKQTPSCDEGSWPDRDHALVCGSCKVLVDHFSSVYKTCQGYCSRIGRQCVGAWEEIDDTCNVLHDLTCDQQIDSSDAICECSPEVDLCYDSLTHVASDEGEGVGSEVTAQSVEECKRRCNEDDECNSFAYCPDWNACWMKDKVVEAGEPVREFFDCKTYFKKKNCMTIAEPTKPSPQGCSGSACKSIKVMSYNTEYKNYNARMGGYADKIKAIAPAIVGLQECQDRDGLARKSGYRANTETGRQNYMLFDPSKVSFVSGGHMRIPRDNYAPRAITWGKFKLGGVTIWFFNTHLPHNHNEAHSQTTHARIADMFLQKRRELGAESAPTIVVGDMNSHASNFNKVHTGGFESNLESNGFVWAYTARGRPGYSGIDHILYSSEHWTHSGCKDTGTGGSDHTSITCDLTLKQ